MASQIQQKRKPFKIELLVYFVSNVCLKKMASQIQQKRKPTH